MPHVATNFARHARVHGLCVLCGVHVLEKLIHLYGQHGDVIHFMYASCLGRLGLPLVLAAMISDLLLNESLGLPDLRGKECPVDNRVKVFACRTVELMVESLNHQQILHSVVWACLRCTLGISPMLRECSHLLAVGR